MRTRRSRRRFQFICKHNRIVIAERNIAEICADRPPTDPRAVSSLSWAPKGT